MPLYLRRFQWDGEEGKPDLPEWMHALGDVFNAARAMVVLARPITDDDDDDCLASMQLLEDQAQAGKNAHLN